jgi:hypothetical protein
MSDIATEATEAANVAHTRFGLRSLLALHLFVVWQVWMMLDGWFALVHAFMPPWLPMQAAGLIVRAPFFALLCLTMAAMVLAVAFMSLRQAMRSRGRWTRILTTTVAVLWTPLLCGELIRIVLTEPALASTRPECRGSTPLATSIRLRLIDDRPHQPHAWVVHGREVRLWSYRTLAFVPAPGWSGTPIAIERCATAPARRPSR